MLRNLFPFFQLHFYASEIIFGLFVLFFGKNYKVTVGNGFIAIFSKILKRNFARIPANFFILLDHQLMTMLHMRKLN
jgi:hypothetical protein